MARRKSIRIRGKKIPIIRKKLLPNAYGFTCKGKRPVIEIDRSLRGIAKLRTVIHESLHQFSFNLSEDTVLKLEDFVLELIIDNPELFHDLHNLIEEKKKCES